MRLFLIITILIISAIIVSGCSIDRAHRYSSESRRYEKTEDQWLWGEENFGGR